MTGKTTPVAIDEDRLAEVSAGADAAQRSRVTSLTVTFSTQTTFNEGDPDKPIVAGNVPNSGR